MLMSFEIDTSLYDRQIRTYGEEAVKKITTSSVVIIGLENGLATEIAKNLALGGVKQIYLFDNELVSQKNLETGFYYSESNIGEVRSKVLSDKVKELNPYVNVTAIESEESIPEASTLIIVNQSPDKVTYFENKFKSRMICVFSSGCAGMVFSYAGESHVVTDIMGENIEPVQIGSIDSSGKVLCAVHHSHEFQSGDFIRFENVEGENTETLINQEFEITVKSPTCFTIDDTFDFSNIKFKNGTAVLIKKPTTISHQPFSVQIENPSFNFVFDDSETIFKTLTKYFNNQKIFETENPWSESHTSLLTDNFNDNASLARTFGFEFLPVFSLIGSVAASETIKLITNKYMPINQFWCWYEPKLIPSIQPSSIGLTSIGKLYGSDVETEIGKSSWFMVGSGAIGCELLKNLAFMNVATNGGTIYLTDPDNIEKSNLNRQFLFRSHHIGKPKSQMASESMKSMKPTFNVVGLTQKVCKENQNFTDKIMSQVTGVFNALDNIHARRYMDEQCFNKQKPLFESGTTGTKGNTQAVIPYLTETYSNSADPPQEKSFPICTIKNFPNEIQHTIHWAMDYFEIFNRAPQNINKWIKDKSVFDNGVSVENSQGKEDVMNFLIKLKIKTFEDCVYRAIDMFYQNYKHQIVQLLTSYPADCKTSEGTSFWSNGKRMPTPFDKFDYTNNHHLDYVEATSHLIARVYNLKDTVTREEIKIMASSYDYIDNFKANKDVKIASKDSEIQTSMVDIELPDNSEYKDLVLRSEEFEKDDITNWHIQFITATSNLRAINYGIPPTSFQETKGIAGRIIPAIATTTSVVSGLIVLEMVKYMLAKCKTIENKIENYRSTFVNLADTTLVYSEPIPSGTIEIAGQKFNNWTKFEFTQDVSLEKFKEYYENIFKTEISMIVYGTSMLYSDFMDCQTDKSKKLSEIIKNIDSTVDFTEVSIITIASSDDDINLPDIHFRLENYLELSK
jgi:ubiquitin-activating enzyme E1